jgi:hypothetical protein
VEGGAIARWLTFIAGLVIGGAAGAGGMLVAFPFLFPPPVVNEQAPAASSGETGATLLGSFRFDEMAVGRDAIHWANGTGGVYRDQAMTIIRFDDSFEAGPGPNYWVYLNTVPGGDEDAFNADAGRLKLAPLKSFTGGQNYRLPTDVRIEDFQMVTVWCESFGVYIGSAPLPAL